jgi:hypothetical protein
MSRPQEYTALAYVTYTGKVYAELALASTPTWSQGINDEGNFDVSVSLGHTRAYQDTARSVEKTAALSWFSSIAVLYGDTVCIAGPVIKPEINDDGTEMKLRGKGIWEMLNGHLLTHVNYNPLTQSLLSTDADVSYTDSLPNIAKSVVRDAMLKPNDVATSLPITIEPNVGSGSNFREWFGYQFGYVGTRLKDITQVEDGPDVLFTARYNDVSQYVTHRMNVGNPYLVQGGDPVMLDYGSNMIAVKENLDGEKFAQKYYVKGSGDKRETQYAWNGFNTTISRGYPKREYVDTTHASAEQSDTLQGWANANQTTFGNGAVRSWTAKVKAEVLHTVRPGYLTKMNMKGHGWIDDGLYQGRLIDWGQQSADDDGLLTVALEVWG